MTFVAINDHRSDGLGFFPADTHLKQRPLESAAQYVEQLSVLTADLIRAQTLFRVLFNAHQLRRRRQRHQHFSRGLITRRRLQHQTVQTQSIFHGRRVPEAIGAVMDSNDVEIERIGRSA
jgi:hypothetical protein